MTAVLGSRTDVTLAALCGAAFEDEPAGSIGDPQADGPAPESAAHPAGVAHLRPLPAYVSRAIAFSTMAGGSSASRGAPSLTERDLGRPAAGTAAAISAALGGVVAVLDRRRLELSERILALSIEAYRAPLDAYHPALAELWDDPHQSLALRRLDELLGSGGAARQRHQAPVSYRIVPRLTGQAHRALAQLEEVATVALRGPTPDPNRRVPVDDLCHDAPVAAAIDAMSATWVDIGALAHRHVVRLMRADRGGRARPLRAPTDVIDEMRRLAQPAVLGALEISSDPYEDVAPLAPAAYLSHRRVTARLDEVLAVLAATCAGAESLREAGLSAAVSEALDAVGRHAPAAGAAWSATELANLAAAISESIDGGRALGR